MMANFLEIDMRHEEIIVDRREAYTLSGFWCDQQVYNSFYIEVPAISPLMSKEWGKVIVGIRAFRDPPYLGKTLSSYLVHATAPLDLRTWWHPSHFHSICHWHHDRWHFSTDILCRNNTLTLLLKSLSRMLITTHINSIVILSHTCCVLRTKVDKKNYFADYRRRSREEERDNHQPLFWIVVAGSPRSLPFYSFYKHKKKTPNGVDSFSNSVQW